MAATALPAPAMVAAAAIGTVSCKPGPSRVAQGLRYEANDATYDQFFAAFYETQLLLGQGPEREAEAREKLAEAVGAAGADLEPLIAAVRKQTERMKGEGITLSLTVSEPDDEPSAELKITAGLVEEKDGRVNTAIVEAAKAEAKLLARVAEAKAAVAQFREQLPTLKANVDTTFRKSVGARGEVERNLGDAEKLIPLMEQRADEIAALARKTVEGLLDAANTTPEGAPTEEPLPETPGAAPPAGGAPGPAQAGAPKPAPAPGPAPAPKKKAPPAADGFEP